MARKRRKRRRAKRSKCLGRSNMTKMREKTLALTRRTSRPSYARCLIRENARKETRVTLHTVTRTCEAYLISKKLDYASPSRTENVPNHPASANTPTEKENFVS